MTYLIPLAVAALLQVTPSPTLEQGRALTSAFYEGKTETLWPRLSDRMRQALGSADNLRAFREQVRGQAGVEEAVVEEKVEKADGLDVYLRVTRFSKAPVPVLVQWAFGPGGTVEGFFIRPVAQEAASERLDYTPKTVLRLPFTGRWFVFWGGRTIAQNYHASTIDQRFAYDILVYREGRSHEGEGRGNEDYYCFGQKLLAPAAGVVAALENEIEDNVPGVMNGQKPMGNHVILDHGNGEFSFLCHFRKGTVAVKKGDAVKAGDFLGECGNSGNSSEPHLHYHLQDTAEFQKGRGLPPVFEDYQADGTPVARGEPVKGQTVEPR